MEKSITKKSDRKKIQVVFTLCNSEAGMYLTGPLGTHVGYHRYFNDPFLYFFLLINKHFKIQINFNYINNSAIISVGQLEVF